MCTVLIQDFFGKASYRFFQQNRTQNKSAQQQDVFSYKINVHIIDYIGDVLNMFVE